MENRKWKKTDEYLLEEWADHSRVFRWMHDRSRTKYWHKNISFQIPVIILSTITGAANFAQDRIALEWRGYYALIVGFTNIIAGIIATISTFLKVSEFLEGHRVSSIAWAKYYHNVKTELQREPDDRENVVDFMKYAKLEYEKLVEQSPPIPHDIILRFRRRYENSGAKMYLPPIIGAFDRFNIGEDSIIEKEKSGIERVLNVLGDDSLENRSHSDHPDSKISNAVGLYGHLTKISDNDDVESNFGFLGKKITQEINKEMGKIGETVQQILEEPEEVNIITDMDEKED